MLLSLKKLFVYFADVLNSPLPFSPLSLEKDRWDGRLGIPYHKLAGSILYDPDEIKSFLTGLPVVYPKRPMQVTKLAKKRGKPKKEETIEANKLGISVPELRKRRGVI